MKLRDRLFFMMNKNKLLDVEEKLEQILGEDTKIVAKIENQNLNLDIEGSDLGLFLVLATVERSILEQSGASKKDFEFIKRIEAINATDYEYEMEAEQCK